MSDIIEAASESEWVLVPRALTEGMRKTLHSNVMIRCYLDKREASILNDQAWWEAVLASAPSPEAGAGGDLKQRRDENGFECEYDGSLGPDADDYTILWDNGARWLLVQRDGKITIGRSPAEGQQCFTTTWEELFSNRSGKLSTDREGQQSGGETHKGSGSQASPEAPSDLRHKGFDPSREWRPIATAPTDGTAIWLRCGDEEYRGYWGLGDNGWSQHGYYMWLYTPEGSRPSAWAPITDGKPLVALAGEAEGRDRQGSVHEHAAPQGATP